VRGQPRTCATRAAAMTAKQPLIPVAWGEVVDRKTILEIKVARLRAPGAVDNARRELALLRAVLEQIAPRPAALDALERELRAVNARLWDIEDAIRAKEAANSFDGEFVALARAVYRTNDERSRLKREISLLLESDILDEKQYAPY
jgi:hypothetical protein